MLFIPAVLSDIALLCGLLGQSSHKHQFGLLPLCKLGIHARKINLLNILECDSTVKLAAISRAL